jgi:hypothetical protein
MNCNQSRRIPPSPLNKQAAVKRKSQHSLDATFSTNFPPHSRVTSSNDKVMDKQVPKDITAMEASGESTAVVAKAEPVTVATSSSEAKAASVPSSDLADLLPAPSDPLSSDARIKDSESSVSAVSRDDAKSETTASLPPTTKKPKKDRSNLRKGKWTVSQQPQTRLIVQRVATLRRASIGSRVGW